MRRPKSKIADILLPVFVATTLLLSMVAVVQLFVVNLAGASAVVGCAYDWAWDSPSPREVKTGCGVALRYVDEPNSLNGKQVTNYELSQQLAAGNRVALVLERWAGRAREGCQAGVTDANRANRGLDYLGLSRDTVVYLAVDEDDTVNRPPFPLQAVRDYIECWSNTRGYAITGVYGSVRIVSMAMTMGDHYGWATYAWKYGQPWPAGAQIRQVRNDVAYGSGTVDLNDLMSNDFGAVSRSYSPPVPVVPPVATPTPQGVTYTVRSGDYLSGSVARACGTTWQAVASANGLRSPYTIYPGQVLKCSAGGSAGGSAGRTYTVRSGDYLSGPVARACGTPWRTIASVNGIRSPYIIYPGRTLRCS